MSYRKGVRLLDITFLDELDTALFFTVSRYRLEEVT